jgi:hypothetical protein
MSPAASAAERVPTRLVWDGSACGGTEQDFAARVVRRNRAIRFVPSGEHVSVRLSIEPSSGGLDARVRIEARGRAPVTRRIQSPDCEDALDALALVVAIGVESRPASAARRPRSRAQPAAPPRPPAPAPAEATTPPEPAPPEPAPGGETSAPSAATPPVEPAPASPASPLAATPAEPGPPPPSAPPTDVPGSTPEAAAGGLFIGAGLAALGTVGIAPEPLLGGAVWLSAEWDRTGVWAPEVVLDALHQELNGHGEARGEASFQLNASSLALCPLRLGSSTLELRPCLSGAVGQLGADGGQTYAPREQTRTWGSLGASVSASIVLGVVQLRASLAVSAPLRRDSFRFGGDCLGAACEADVFHRVAPLIWTGALGAGLTPPRASTD